MSTTTTDEEDPYQSEDYQRFIAEVSKTCQAPAMTMDQIKAQLREIIRLAKLATPGPWHYWDQPSNDLIAMAHTPTGTANS